MTFFKPKKDNAHEVFRYGFTSGEQAERERIIKLLMESSIELRYWDGQKVRDIKHWTHTAEEAKAELSALIKGEEQ